MKNKLNQEITWLIKEKGTQNLEADLLRLKEGEPIDYVIGWKDFLGARIDLSFKPLIPRPETEFWAQQAILSLKELSRGRVLDIFSGSGCVGVAIAQNCPNLLCDSSDISQEAVKQIKLNYKINKINPKKYRVINSDIFSNIKHKYDFILANPPYIPIKNKNKIQKSALKYEPKKALFGGGDGLYYINKFLKQAPNYLAKSGAIYMEFDSPQKNAINKLLKKYKYQTWNFYKDQYGKWRFVVIK